MRNPLNPFICIFFMLEGIFTCAAIFLDFPLKELVVISYFLITLGLSAYTVVQLYAYATAQNIRIKQDWRFHYKFIALGISLALSIGLIDPNVLTSIPGKVIVLLATVALIVYYGLLLFGTEHTQV